MTTNFFVQILGAVLDLSISQSKPIPLKEGQIVYAGLPGLEKMSGINFLWNVEQLKIFTIFFISRPFISEYAFLSVNHKK